MWVTDVIHICTLEGVADLAIVIDLFFRRVGAGGAN